MTRLALFTKNLNSALLLFLLHTILGVSFAALVFSGPLSGWVSTAISLFLVGNALLCLLVALFSSYGGSIALSQDTPGVVLAVAAASIAASLPAEENSRRTFATVLILIVGTTLLMGLVFLMMGAFRLGRFVRFLPYPVMGGFLAGTGWLLVEGGLGVMTNAPIGPGLLDRSMLVLWLPGLLLALGLLVGINKIKKATVIPLVFGVALALFYAAMWLQRVPVADLFALGWLLGPFPEGAAWRFPLSAQTLSEVDWPVLVRALPVAAPALLIGPLALLLNVSGLELVVKRDIDANRELITAGLGNVAAGLAGGLIGYHAISLSSLNHSISKGSRLPGVLVAVFLGVILVVGVPLLSYIPRFVLGGLVAYLGLSLLYEWVYKVWFSFPLIDIIIINAILIVIVSTNFIWGILAGLALTVVMFVISYSKIDVVKYSLTGKTRRSRFTRPPVQAEHIWSTGDQLAIYKLQGFIFFGTASDLYERVRQRLRAVDQVPVRYILMDFSMVPGLDSTGLLYFNKLAQLIQEHEAQILFTGLNERVHNQFHRGGFNESTSLHHLPDLDHGIEWYENRVISEASLEISQPCSMLDYLRTALPEEIHLDRLVGAMQRIETQPGQYLIRQGDNSNELFFIESGQVTAQMENGGSEPLRLETMTGGRVVGEVGFYLNTPRTASIMVDQPGVVYSLSSDSFEQLKRADPQTAFALQTFIVRQLGERVAHLTRTVDDLQG